MQHEACMRLVCIAVAVDISSYDQGLGCTCWKAPLLSQACAAALHSMSTGCSV